jgi:hypothetical protein
MKLTSGTTIYIDDDDGDPCKGVVKKIKGTYAVCDFDGIGTEVCSISSLRTSKYIPQKLPDGAVGFCHYCGGGVAYKLGSFGEATCEGCR